MLHLHAWISNTESKWTETQMVVEISPPSGSEFLARCVPCCCARGTPLTQPPPLRLALEPHALCPHCHGTSNRLGPLPSPPRQAVPIDRGTGSATHPSSRLPRSGHGAACRQKGSRDSSEMRHHFIPTAHGTLFAFEPDSRQFFPIRLLSFADC